MSELMKTNEERLYQKIIAPEGIGMDKEAIWFLVSTY
jgi:hypothetical protein